MPLTLRTAPAAHAALPSRSTPRRLGFTIIEVAMVLGIAAIFAAMALPAIDFNRFRMDANARYVQNQLLGAQARAVQRNTQVLVEIFYDRGQFRIVDDTSASGAWESGESRIYGTLSNGMQFVIPPSTIDSVTPNYATGAGITIGAGSRPILIFYPNGSSSGDAVIYLGSPKARLQDNRAIKITGATSKMYFYRMTAAGTWALSEM
mgnify:CR=1 FL=1